MKKLQHQILLAFMIFILFPILIIGIVSYQISSSTLKKNISQQTLQTLSSIDLNLQSSFSEINSFSDNIIDSNEIQSLLKYENNSTAAELFTNRLAAAGMMYSNPFVSDFVLYGNNGSFFHLKNTRVPSFEDLKESSFFQEIVQKKGEPVWMPSIENELFGETNELVFTQGRVVKDVNTLQDIGYVLLQVKIDLLDDLFVKIHQPKSEELLINEKGEIIYSFNHDLIGQRFIIDDFSIITSNKQGYFISEWNEEKSLITFLPSNLENISGDKLYLISIKNWDVLTNQVQYVRNTMIVLALSGIFFAIMFNVLYLKRILAFIKEFLKNMKRAEKGDLLARMPHYPFDEFENLAAGFNKMLEQIGFLLKEIKREQKRKRIAEFRVLQQQINPHFLYNTLESINALAAMNGQKEISKMTINLGKLLRISIQSADEVLVKDEISHVMSYMEIQKVRFNNKFNFEIDIEEKLKDYVILKLVLQPLVENILQHAFNNQTTNGVIQIKGLIQNNQGCLFVKDNGKGMTQQALIKLNTKERKKGTRNRGVGIQNVYERLKLYYGNKYGLTICSMENEGTIVKVTFPLKVGENNGL